MKYEIIEQPLGGEILKQTGDDGQVWWIAIDKSNSDYQAYLESLKDAAN